MNESWDKLNNSDFETSKSFAWSFEVAWNLRFWNKHKAWNSETSQIVRILTFLNKHGPWKPAWNFRFWNKHEAWNFETSQIVRIWSFEISMGLGNQHGTSGFETITSTVRTKTTVSGHCVRNVFLNKGVNFLHSSIQNYGFQDTVSVQWGIFSSIKE